MLSFHILFCYVCLFFGLFNLVHAGGPQIVGMALCHASFKIEPALAKRFAASSVQGLLLALETCFSHAD